MHICIVALPYQGHVSVMLNGMVLFVSSQLPKRQGKREREMNIVSVLAETE